MEHMKRNKPVARVYSAQHGHTFYFMKRIDGKLVYTTTYQLGKWHKVDDAEEPAYSRMLKITGETK